MPLSPEFQKKLAEHRAGLPEDKRRLEALESIADSLRSIDLSVSEFVKTWARKTDNFQR